MLPKPLQPTLLPQPQQLISLQKSYTYQQMSISNDVKNSDSQQKQQNNQSINDQGTNDQTVNTDNNNKKKSKRKKIHAGLIANLIETQYPVVKKVVAGMLGMKVIRDAGVDDWDLFWTDNAVTSETVAKLKPYQKINHFPGMYTLSRKNYLARNLIKMQKKFPKDYNFFPKTWVLPSQLNQFRSFMQNETNPVVIAKPEASSQGRGIFLSKSFEDFEFGEHYVVQKYLKKPFLIDGLKFDLRVYVLVAGCDPLRVYVYKEGLARFATQPYCTPKKQNLNNLFMHLTNYAINKNSEKFQFNNSTTQMNKGHKRSLTAIMTKLEQLGHSKQKTWQQIKDCIAKTIISAQPLLAHQYRSSQPNNYANNVCFQLLGFDVILDHNLKPQVLEVNYTPSFTTDTPLDLQIKKNLIHDALLLMNLTNKAKNQIIYDKKKQMKQRTLTGKNFNQRENRQILVQKAQMSRNIWESKHMGNFDRILPVVMELPQKIVVKLEKQKKQQPSNKTVQHSESSPQIQQPKIQQVVTIEPQTQEWEQKKQVEQRYKKFLQYSLQSYQNNTGANIRRNVKVSQSNKNQNNNYNYNSTGQGINLIHGTSSGGNFSNNLYTDDNQNKTSTINNGDQQTIGSSIGKNNIINQVKYTNTENLQKIYKSKIRPMMYKKISQTVSKRPKQQQNNMKTPQLSKNISEQQHQKTKTSNPNSNPYLTSYVAMKTNGMHVKHKSANSSYANNQGKVVVEGNYAKKEGEEGVKKDVNEKKDLNEKKVRNASQFKKGLSTVYNVTFVDKRK